MYPRLGTPGLNRRRMKKLLEWFVKTTTADVYMNCVIDQNWR